MNKNFLSILILFFLCNCASPGSVFLGPVITGAKTGSVYQASLSYSSGRIIDVIKNNVDEKSEVELIDKKKSKNTSQPPVLVAILTTTIEIKDIFDQEPLP